MGAHYMIIYKNLDILRKFYTKYTKRQIKDNNESVLINPFYETTDSVRQIFYEDMLMDISGYEREGALLIMDALEIYFGPEPDRIFKERRAHQVKKLGKEGLSILNDTGAYPYKGMIKELVDYELSLPTVFDLPLKRFCMFHEKDFDRLTDEQKHKLIDHHGMTIRIF